MSQSWSLLFVRTDNSDAMPHVQDLAQEVAETTILVRINSAVL